LDGILCLWCVDCSPQLGVISKLAEGALDPTADVTDEDILKSINPSRDPRGTPLVTDLHPNTESLTTTLWVWSYSYPLILFLNLKQHDSSLKADSVLVEEKNTKLH